MEKTGTLRKFIVLKAMVLISLMGCGRSDDDPIDESTIKSGIPQEIMKVIFENSDFSTPIILRLPCEDDPSEIERLKNRVHNLPPAFFSRFSDHRLRGVLDVLIQRGYIDVEKIRVSWRTRAGTQSETREVLGYTEKIRPYVHKVKIGTLLEQTVDFSEAKLEECRKHGGSREIRLATRELKSIDFENRYETPAIAGIPGYEVFAVRFSYKLKKDFPHFNELAEARAMAWPQIPLDSLRFDDIYEGEAKAYLSTDFGRWELDYIRLDDKQIR